MAFPAPPLRRHPRRGEARERHGVRESARAFPHLSRPRWIRSRRDAETQSGLKSWTRISRIGFCTHDSSDQENPEHDQEVQDHGLPTKMDPDTTGRGTKSDFGTGPQLEQNPTPGKPILIVRSFRIHTCPESQASLRRKPGLSPLSHWPTRNGPVVAQFCGCGLPIRFIDSFGFRFGPHPNVLRKTAFQLFPKLSRHLR
jgi:hypothetical protein